MLSLIYAILYLLSKTHMKSAKRSWLRGCRMEWRLVLVASSKHHIIKGENCNERVGEDEKHRLLVQAQRKIMTQHASMWFRGWLWVNVWLLAPPKTHFVTCYIKFTLWKLSVNPAEIQTKYTVQGDKGPCKEIKGTFTFQIPLPVQLQSPK